MKTYKLKVYSTFHITGKGKVFTAHRDENEVEGITKGDHVVARGIEYEVTGIEQFRNLTGTGKNIGLLVKEIEDHDN